MGITLRRAVPCYRQTSVGDMLVDRLAGSAVLDVPGSLREHTWAVMDESFGPLTRVWRTMGEFRLHGAPRILVARVAVVRGAWRVQYGTVPHTLTLPPDCSELSGGRS